MDKALISYISLYGPPVLGAIRALEKMSIPKKEVCIMDSLIEASLPTSIGQLDEVEEFSRGYFQSLGTLDIERCNNIISKSGESMGDYDFYFEWFKAPALEQIEELIAEIDKTLSPLGVRYKITTK